MIPSAFKIIDYWYSDKIKKHWFASTSEIDAEILKYFQKVWQQAADGSLSHWQQAALSCLALVIVLDQFPLNMFRGQVKSFQTEKQALSVARYAIAHGFIKELNQEQLLFLFMPFIHSEQLADQDLAVHLFKKNNLTESLKFAKHHRELIRKFTRFPHRNGILGRKNTKAESLYLKSKEAFLG